MNLLLAKPAQDEMRRLGPRDSTSLKRVIEALNSLDSSALDWNPNVRRVEDAEGGIYVIREGGIRAFFSRKGNDLVVLSITNG